MLSANAASLSLCCWRDSLADVFQPKEDNLPTLADIPYGKAGGRRFRIAGSFMLLY